MTLESRESVCVFDRRSGQVRCVRRTIIASVLGVFFALLLSVTARWGHAAAESHYVLARVVESTRYLISEPHYSVSEIDEGYAELNGIMTVEVTSDWFWQLTVEVTPLYCAPGAKMPDQSVLELRFKSLSDGDWSDWVQPSGWALLGSKNSSVQFEYRVDVKGIQPDPSAPNPGIRGSYVFEVKFAPSLFDPDR